MLELYTLSCHYLEWQTTWDNPPYLENEIVHFHYFLGKKGTFHLKFSIWDGKKMNPPEMWDRQILWKSTFVCFLVQDMLLLFGDLLVIFLNLFCWILFGRHFLSFSLKLPARKGHKLIPQYSGASCQCHAKSSSGDFCAPCWWLKPIEIQLVGSFCDRATDDQSRLVSISISAFRGLMYSMFPWIGSIGCDSQQILFPLQNQPWK